MKFLLQEGADVSKLDRHGRQALHLAAYQGSVEAVELLLDSGADIHCRDADGFTPFFYAATVYADWKTTSYSDLSFHHPHPPGDRNAEVMENLILRGVPIPSGDSCVYLVHRLSSKSLTSTMQVILKYKPDLVNAELNGATPLHKAVSWSDRPRMVKLLLDAGADILKQDTEGNTPLHMAEVIPRSIKTVRLLLKAGSDPLVPNHKGATALYNASYCRFPRTFELLLATGVNSAAFESQVRPSILLNIAAQREEMVKSLIRAGVDGLQGRSLLYSCLVWASQND